VRKVTLTFLGSLYNFDIYEPSLFLGGIALKWNSIIFIIGFIIAFAGGYLFFTAGNSEDNASITIVEDESDPSEQEELEEKEEKKTEEEDQVIIPEDAEVLSRNGCLSCHAVEALEVEGGNIGPDLTIAYSGVEGKHGKDLDSFLQIPTSAVMATVIDDHPLDDEEREQIVELLKKASEEVEEE